MSSAMYDEVGGAKFFAERAIKYRAERAQVRHAQASEDLAGALKVPPGTLSNLLRDRLKKISGKVREGLADLLLAEIQHKVAELYDEARLVSDLRGNPRVCLDQLEAIEADLAAIKSLVLMRG